MSTQKLVDTLEEQALLEAELERTKPPGPPECAHLHYLLATPFRYGRYPGNSRFRREGRNCVLSAAVFRREPWPHNPLEFTGFETKYAVAAALDLTAALLVADEQAWTHLSDYSACLDLADAAREAEIGAIRYRSVRDPEGRANLALLSCTAFLDIKPERMVTWRISLSSHGANALCDWPENRLAFAPDLFTADARLAGLARRVQ